MRYELPERVGADQIVDRVTAKITGQKRSSDESQTVEEQRRGPIEAEQKISRQNSGRTHREGRTATKY
jgi:hypothetical protein